MHPMTSHPLTIRSLVHLALLALTLWMSYLGKVTLFEGKHISYMRTQCTHL